MAKVYILPLIKFLDIFNATIALHPYLVHIINSRDTDSGDYFTLTCARCVLIARLSSDVRNLDTTLGSKSNSHIFCPTTFIFHSSQYQKKMDQVILFSELCLRL